MFAKRFTIVFSMFLSIAIRGDASDAILIEVNQPASSGLIQLNDGSVVTTAGALNTLKTAPWVSGFEPSGNYTVAELSGDPPFFARLEAFEGNGLALQNARGAGGLYLLQGEPASGLWKSGAAIKNTFGVLGILDNGPLKKIIPWKLGSLIEVKNADTLPNVSSSTPVIGTAPNETLLLIQQSQAFVLPFSLTVAKSKFDLLEVIDAAAGQIFSAKVAGDDWNPDTGVITAIIGNLPLRRAQVARVSVTIWSVDANSEVREIIRNCNVNRNRPYIYQTTLSSGSIKKGNVVCLLVEDWDCGIPLKIPTTEIEKIVNEISAVHQDQWECDDLWKRIRQIPASEFAHNYCLTQFLATSDLRYNNGSTYFHIRPSELKLKGTIVSTISRVSSIMGKL